MSSPPPIRVFYSYSHKDEALREELETHLAVLLRQNLIDDWKDRQIEAGAAWDDEIKQRLEDAELILLLISPDFMASNYIWKNELASAIRRHEQGTARVVPIFARPVDVTGTEFAKLQGLPRDAKPVITWAIRDEAWLDVAKGIRRVVETLRAKRAAPTP